MNWHSDQAILFMRSYGDVQEVFKFIESSFSPWLPQFLYVYFLCVVHCIDAYLNLCTAVHTSNSLYNFTHRHTYVHSTASHTSASCPPIAMPMPLPQLSSPSQCKRSRPTIQYFSIEGQEPCLSRDWLQPFLSQLMEIMVPDIYIFESFLRDPCLGVFHRAVWMSSIISLVNRMSWISLPVKLLNRVSGCLW